jgi:hypothetical protein
MAGGDWPFTGENPEITDLCGAEEMPEESRELAYELESTIGWLALGLSRTYTDTAPRRR